jgi:transcriptional regulator of arginine metabolism
MDRLTRQETIMLILRDQWIRNQEELQKALESKGFDVTQATLSRDLRQLHVMKILDPVKGSRYILPEDKDMREVMNRLPDHLDGVLTLEFSGQFGVIRTLPGFANGVAFTIDYQQIPEIMGTIAGDDTILVILKEGISKNLIAGVLSSKFPGLSLKFIG